MIFVGDDFCTASSLCLCCVFVLIFGLCAPFVILPYIFELGSKSVPGMPINHIIFLIEWGCINVVEVVVVHCLDSANKIKYVYSSTSSHICSSKLIVLSLILRRAKYNLRFFPRCYEYI